MDTARNLIADAYVLLLKIPHTDPVRVQAQEALCIVRDLLAAVDGTSPEETQDVYEAIANMDVPKLQAYKTKWLRSLLDTL